MFAGEDFRLTATSGKGVELYGDSTGSNANPSPLKGPGKNCGYSESAGCTAVVFERFRTSFNTASNNQFGSLWMRGTSTNWIFVGLQITDQMYGGTGIVTGGAPDTVLEDVLNLFTDTIVIGQSQVIGASCQQCFDSVAASADCDAGCVRDTESGLFPDKFCSDDQSEHPMSYAQHVTNTPFTAKKTFANIYDGPFYVDGLRVLYQPTPPNIEYGSCYDSVTPSAILRKGSLSGRLPVITQAEYEANPSNFDLRMPHGVIGWKQSNGFTYPVRRLLSSF